VLSSHEIINYISALAFLAVAVLDILRIAYKWTFIFRSGTVPMWYSALEAAIAIILAILLIWSAKV